MHANVSDLYSEYLEMYIYKYKALSFAHKKGWVINMILLIYSSKHDYNNLFENEESTDTTSRKSYK